MRLSLASLLLLGALAAPAHAQTTAPAPNPFGPGAARPNQAPPPNPPAIPAKPAAPAPTTQAPASTAPAPHAPAAGAVFPSAVSPKYAKEPAGTARQNTCLDQYNANKAAGGAGNGGLNWIEKGGGYYSECNKRLKG